MGGGSIIVEVPSCDDALLSLFGSLEFSDFTYWSCHLYLFNPATLERLLSSLNKKVTIDHITQIQRYPLSNHLYWLSQGKPGGHKKWTFLNNKELESQYEYALASIGACDTIVAQISYN